MKQFGRWIAGTVVVLGASLALFVNGAFHSPSVILQPVSFNQVIDNASSSSAEGTIPKKSNIDWPLDRPEERMTKKPFGIKVTPKNSPVMPERFSGYHTGVDFETFPQEAEIDVSVRAICTGKLLVKRSATGYGGVVVQACTIEGQAMTVVYGHLKLSSILKPVGDELAQGESFAVLGKGDSSETDGERKHLHLGIHGGSSVTILGYVLKRSELKDWRDAQALIQNGI